MSEQIGTVTYFRAPPTFGIEWFHSLDCGYALQGKSQKTLVVADQTWSESTLALGASRRNGVGQCAERQPEAFGSARGPRSAPLRMI